MRHLLAHTHGTNFLKMSDLSRTRQLLENISRHTFLIPFLINCSCLFLTFILRDGLILSVYRRTTSMLWWWWWWCIEEITAVTISQFVICYSSSEDKINNHTECITSSMNEHHIITKFIDISHTLTDKPHAIVRANQLCKPA